jgi:sulfotransferase
MDSFECLFRRNAFDYSRIYGQDSRATVYTRCESLAKFDSVVGYAWSGLKEAYYGEYSSSLLLIDYELLTRFPEKTISLVYQFTGEEPYPHDYHHVEYDEPEFDHQVGAKGLHKVKSKVEFKPRKTVLPPDLFEKYDKLSFWTDQRGSGANVITAKPVEDEEKQDDITDSAENG